MATSVKTVTIHLDNTHNNLSLHEDSLLAKLSFSLNPSLSLYLSDSSFLVPNCIPATCLF